MNNLERYTLFCALIVAIGCAGMFWGLSHATICERQVGTPDNVAYLACETRGK